MHVFVSPRHGKKGRLTLKLLRHPGWTTPVEFVLVDGITQAMHVHARALVEMKQVLPEGSRAIVEAGVERVS